MMTHKLADGKALCKVAAQIADINPPDMWNYAANQPTTAVPTEVSCPRCVALSKALRNAPTPVGNTTTSMQRHLYKP